MVKVAKKIAREVNNMETDKNTYRFGISKELCARYVSYTLLKSFSQILERKWTTHRQRYL